MITNSPVLTFESLLNSVDSSSKGMGAVILQNERPVAYASQSLTKCQQNNAQIEKINASNRF